MNAPADVERYDMARYGVRNNSKASLGNSQWPSLDDRLLETNGYGQPAVQLCHRTPEKLYYKSSPENTARLTHLPTPNFHLNQNLVLLEV